MNKNSILHTDSQFEELNKILEDQVTDNLKLESVLQNLTDLINHINTNENKNNILNSNEKIRNFMDSASQWILKNFSSIKLNSVISFISFLLLKLEITIEIKREDILKLLQLETYDELILNEKKDKKNYEEILSSDSILTNSFLSAFYALIVTISNKPEIIVKSKNLLKSVIMVMTQICEVDNVAIYYKKKRLISVFCKILKELKNAKDCQDSLMNISKYLMNLFAKIGMKRPIYRDYLFKKAVPDKITDVFQIFYSKDYELVNYFSVYCFFSVRIIDHKTYFWSKGVINNLLEILNKILSENVQENIQDNNENLIEYITLCIYNLSLDNLEVQTELIDLNFLEIAKQILMKFSKNNFIIFNIISILRRIKDEEYMSKITEELLYTYFALFDYFYLYCKKELENNSKICQNKFEFIILKELIAILGNIVKDEAHSKPFIDKNLHLVLIDLKLSFNKFPKIIKNSIGALINLTTSNEIRENISKIAAFIQSIYNVLEMYKDNQAIVDYELKLIINVMKNDITVKTFISGDMFFYLLLFIKNFISHDEIIFNCVKIIRTIILKKKGYEEFNKKVCEFYETISDQNLSNNKHNNDLIFYKMFLEDLIYTLDTKFEYINICIEIFLLLSYLANQNNKFKSILEKSDAFLKIMQKIIKTYEDDEVVSKLISQCLAQLPIEEFESGEK